MHFNAMLKTLGILLMLFSISMIPPIAIALWYQDGNDATFFISFFLTFAVGFFLWISCRNHANELRTRDGFLMVVLIWVVLTVFAAIPFLLALYPTISFTDAVFETVSGLTTTGATAISNIEQLSHALIYYRQQLHLFGGIGIIVLAVAVMPMLGIGGMQLYRAEIAGPMKKNKLTPRITETAKALWYIYFGLATLCALAYWLAGMPLFNAIGESFSTISTGGFATHNSSFAYYHNPMINIIAIIFMILGATNFALHFQLIKQRSLSIYYKDPELMAYFKIIIFTTLLIFIALCVYHYYSPSQSFLNSLFTVVSMSSTTGLTVTNFSIWPTFLPFLIMFIALLGACAGSTTGGIKIIRILCLKEYSKRELNQLIHPKAVYAVKLGNRLLPYQLTQAVWAFLTVFMTLFVILLLVLLATGLDFKTAFGAIAACLSNSGASIGNVADNFKHIPLVAKWICILAMYLGRLEIFTIIVLFTPTYWRN